MSSGPSYPSPTAVQVGGGAAPFYGQNGGSPSQLPADLQRLQQADLSQDTSMMMAASMNGAEHYADHEIPMDDSMGGPTSPERLAQGVLNMEQGDVMATSAARKRSKVSRACDECRRKKIRCDATADNLDDPCTSCRRTNVPCRFSRQPMKRGPSKGYIKELADRLNTLESQLNPNGHLQQQGNHSLFQHEPSRQLPDEPNESPSPAQAQTTRKRTYSASERGNSQREPREREPNRFGMETALDMLMSAYSGSQKAPQKGGVSAGINDLGGFLRTDSLPRDLEQKPDVQDRPPSPNFGGLFRAETAQSHAVAKDDEATLPFYIHNYDLVVDEYYRLIHPTIPLLSHSKSRLHSRLIQAPHSLRKALLGAIDCAVRTHSSGRPEDGGENRTHIATKLINTSQYEDPLPRTFAHSLMYIQCLLLMAVEADNHGLTLTRGRGGSSPSEWLGRAIGAASQLKLNVAAPGDQYSQESDGDNKLGRRIWWIMFILDRWYATSTSSALQLPNDSSALTVEDEGLLGSSTFQSARLAFILGHLSTILQQPASLMAAGSPAAPIINLAILGEVDRFRESVEGALFGTASLTHLCYWHVRLLVMRLTSVTRPHELLAPSLRIVSMLNSIQTPVSLFYHHFAALAAVTLSELCEYEETRPDAERGIDDLMQVLSKRDVEREDFTSWEEVILEMLTRKKARATTPEPFRAIKQLALQQLADAAIGDNRKPAETVGPTNGEDGAANQDAVIVTTSPGRLAPEMLGGGAFDATSLLRAGYLSSFM